jgi:serine protease Do
LVGLLILLLAVWLLPPLVENVEFAFVRGRERAQVEVARAQLADHETMPFVQVSEQVAKSIGPSVVHIDTVQNFSMPQDDIAALFWGQPQHHVAQGQGSGVIIDGQGYVLTNNHVVEGASDMTVSLSDGRKVDAELMGGDPLTDLAVLKINATGLTPAPWGDSEKLPVGAPVWAVGNPYGLDRSVTFGIISAKSRRGLGATPYQEFLQTDAAVNPGNSGGPLVDASGQVVGINTAIVGRSYQGISFAIPSDTAREVYERLRERKPIVRGDLGVQLEELSPPIAQKLGLKDVRGALVTDVYPGGPADQAGIERGDVIVGWNGQPVDNKTTLSFLVARTEVGSAAECMIVRDGQPVTKTVRVTESQQPTPKGRGRSR